MRAKFFQATFTDKKVSYIGTGETEAEAIRAALAEYTKRTGKTADNETYRKSVKVARHRGPAPRAKRRK